MEIIDALKDASRSIRSNALERPLYPLYSVHARLKSDSSPILVKLAQLIEICQVIALSFFSIVIPSFLKRMRS